MTQSPQVHRTNFTIARAAELQRNIHNQGVERPTSRVASGVRSSPGQRPVAGGWAATLACFPSLRGGHPLRGGGVLLPALHAACKALQGVLPQLRHGFWLLLPWRLPRTATISLIGCDRTLGIWGVLPALGRCGLFHNDAESQTFQHSMF